MGDANDIEDDETQMGNMAKILMIMSDEVDVSRDESASNIRYRPRVAAKLRDLWDKERKEDFGKFIEHKVMNWTEEETIVSCAMVAQSPLTLMEEYLKLKQSRKEASDFWTGTERLKRKEHFLNQWGAIVRLLDVTTNVDTRSMISSWYCGVGDEHSPVDNVQPPLAISDSNALHHNNEVKATCHFCKLECPMRTLDYRVAELVRFVNSLGHESKKVWLLDERRPAVYGRGAQRATEVAMISHAAWSTHCDELTALSPGLESKARTDALEHVSEEAKADVKGLKRKYTQAVRVVMPTTPAQGTLAWAHVHTSVGQ